MANPHINEDCNNDTAKKKSSQKKMIKAALKREAQGKLKDAQHYEKHTGKPLSPSTAQRQATARVGTALQQTIRDELTMIDPATGHPYYVDYVHNFLEAAKQDPNCQAARLLASGIFNEQTISALDNTVNNQMNKDLSFLKYRIRETLYDKQREVFDDNYNKTIGVICTRRAGKTELASRTLLWYALANPKVYVLYLNRSFDNAKTQMAKPLIDLMKELDIQYKGTDEFTLPNESVIKFGGFFNKGDIDRYRGGKYILIWCDEIGHLANPKSLIEEVLEPAQIDYGKKAKMIFSGTPPRSKKSFAYEMWHNNEIKHYHWSFLDNPFIPDREGVIEEVCKKHGLTIDAPFIQREYFGNMEAFDYDSMTFKGFKTYDKMPVGQATYAWIGVDWGYEDEAAVCSFVVINNVLYEVESWTASKRSISEICEVVRQERDKLVKEFNPSKQVQIICDTNEKSAVYELSFTYKLPNVFCAYKYDKVFAIDQLAEWMRTGDILIKNKGKLFDEAESTLYKRDEVSDEIIHEIDDSIFHPNAIFALLYVSRQYAFDVKHFDKGSAKSIES